MKSIIKSKRGFAFPTVLGTFVLVTGLVAGLFIMTMNMTMMVSSDAIHSEELFKARNNLDVFLDSVRTNNSIDHTLREDLNLIWEPIEGTNRIKVYYITSTGQHVTSYIILGSSNGNIIDIKDLMSSVDNTISSPSWSWNEKKHTFNEDTIINGDYIIGNWSGGGEIVVAEGKTLFIDGNLILNHGGNKEFEIIGNVCVVGNMEVYIHKNSSDFSVDGDLCVGENLTLTNWGNADVSVSGDTNVMGSLEIILDENGDIELDGDLNVQEDLIIRNWGQGDIEVGGDTVVFGTLSIIITSSGDIEFDGNLIVQENLNITNWGQGNLQIEGDTLVLGSTSIVITSSGDVELDGDLYVQYDLTVTNWGQGDVEVEAYAYVLGNVSIVETSSGDVKINFRSASNIDFSMPLIDGSSNGDSESDSSIIDIIR